VRAEAAAAGLAAAHRRESQEACFLAGGDYRTFLERQGVDARPGPIVGEDGGELGRHDGIWRFTPGQRRGLGIASQEPLFALRTDTSTATLVVGPRRSLATRTVEVHGTLHLDVDRAEVKLRYRSAVVAASVTATGDGFVLELDEPVDAVAPGQVAVLYDEDAVVGSGVITGTTG